eukprot:3078285-Alexandrium_andersonii.AAC.1
MLGGGSRGGNAPGEGHRKAAGNCKKLRECPAVVRAVAQVLLHKLSWRFIQGRGGRGTRTMGRWAI